MTRHGPGGAEVALISPVANQADGVHGAHGSEHDNQHGNESPAYAHALDIGIRSTPLDEGVRGPGQGFCAPAPPGPAVRTALAPRPAASAAGRRPGDGPPMPCRMPSNSSSNASVDVCSGDQSSSARARVVDMT